MSRRLLPLLLLACAGPLPAQEACPGGRISNVFVDNRSIFDLNEVRDRPFGWAYRLANRLHFRTHHRFIRRELLVKEGDCLDPFLLQDSERILRRYPFISRADVFAIQQDDDTWHVLVDTQDEWTTVVEVGAKLDNGLDLVSAELTEESFLGRGITVGAFYRETDAERLLGGRLFTPRLFNTRLDGTLTGGRTRIGSFLEQELFYPFVGEVGRYAGRQRYYFREDYFSYSIGSPDAPEHLLLPVEDERFELTLAMRLGRPGNLTVLGLGISNERLAYPAFPAAVQRVVDNDFGNREPAPAALADRLGPQTAYRRSTRINLLVGQRNIAFERRSGLDALRGVQDVEVGTDLGLTLGRSVGEAAPGRPEDLFGRLRAYAAGTPAPFILAANLGAEARQVLSGGTEGGWRDVLGEVNLLAYWQGAPWQRHTLVGRVAGAGGWNLDQPFQLTLGGIDGVRGYHDEDFPGAHRLLFSAEDRIHFGWPFPDLFDLGATVFGDVGRVWPGEIPFGVDSGWRATLGAGLRVGFPPGSRGVIRLDLAYPLRTSAGLGDVVFRVSFGELVGLQGGFQNPQLVRSRRTTVGPDRFNPPRSAR